MALYDPTATRLQLLTNGYKPIPNLDKRCFLKGWASKAFVDSLSPESIQAWKKQHRNFKATGILVRDGLMPIDLDISDETMVDEMIDRLRDITPAPDTAPWRTGKYPKLMILARWQASTQYPDMFTRLASDKFVDEAGQGHQIEVFGGRPTASGGSSKQIGAFGPHSYEEDEHGKINFKKVLHEYSYEEMGGLTPLTMPLAALPAVTQEQVWELLKAFEEAAEARGWRRQVAPTKAAGSFIYDITEASRFNVQNGPDGLTYEELCAHDIPCRVDGSFIDNSTHRRDKCLVDYCQARGVVGVYDYEGGLWHLPKSAEPDTDAAAEQLADLLAHVPDAKLPEDMPPEPPPLTGEQRYATGQTGPVLERAGWLLRTHAFEAGNIVNIYRPDKGLSEKAARNRFMNWRVDQEGPKGGELPPLIAFNVWLPHEARMNTAGIQMRPDQPYPVFQEEGQLWRNRYRPPAHHKIAVTPTQIAEAAAHFTRLVSNIATGPGEAEYVLHYVAYKMRNPAEPGCSPFFVNPVFGSGRDLFYMIFAALLGEWNCTKQNVRRLIGESGRASFNAFLADKVLVYVGEVLDPELRRSSFDQLKEMIDPRGGVVSVNRKNIEEQDSKRFASIVLATNHVDAIRIEEGDRRFSVLRGGPRLDEAFGVFMETWRKHPVNIAALWQHLMTIDLAGYRPYMPLHTNAKITMIELTKDPIRAALQSIAKDETRTWQVFSLEQLTTEIEGVMGTDSRERRRLEGRLKQARAGLVEPLVIDGEQLVMKVGGKAARIFCFTTESGWHKPVTKNEAKKLLPGGEVSEHAPEENFAAGLEKVTQLDEARRAKKPEKR